MTEEDSEKLNNFFDSFDEHCRINRRDKALMKEDFIKALCYYLNCGLSKEEALNRLNVKNLGGFYARPPILWFPLDDAAKIYPLSMDQGRMAIFRLSVYLKEDVVPEILQMALTFTIKRFPTFATILKKGVFWHYLDTTKRRFIAEKENGLPCRPLKISLSGSQSFRVLYYNNRISIEFFHVLTDGTGGMEFLKTLLVKYLELLGKNIKESDTVLNVDDIPQNEEFENAFKKIPRSANASGFVDKAVVQMSGSLAKVKPCKIIHLKMNSLQLKEISKNTTPQSPFTCLH